MSTDTPPRQILKTLVLVAFALPMCIGGVAFIGLLIADSIGEHGAPAIAFFAVVGGLFGVVALIGGMLGRRAARKNTRAIQSADTTQQKETLAREQRSTLQLLTMLGAAVILVTGTVGIVLANMPVLYYVVIIVAVAVLVYGALTIPKRPIR